MKKIRFLFVALLALSCGSVNAQSLKLYKFVDNAKGKKEPYATTRTLKTYPIGYTYREGDQNPSLSFTPVGKKWYYVREVTNGDTLNTYVRKSNVVISDYRTADLPMTLAGRKFFGDGATIRILPFKKGNKRVSGDSDFKYIMEINLGYYSYTYPLYTTGNNFRTDVIGAKILKANDNYGSIIDRKGNLKCDVDVEVNKDMPTIIYLPDNQAIYYNGKFLRMQK